MQHRTACGIDFTAFFPELRSGLYHSLYLSLYRRKRTWQRSVLGTQKPERYSAKVLDAHIFRPDWGRLHKGMRPPYQDIAGNVTTKQAPPPDGDLWCTVAP
jgi:hypothetical protein